MAYKFFVIPFDEGKRVFEDRDFQKFFREFEVRSVKASFFQTGKNAYWTVFAEYKGKASVPDGWAELSEEEKKKYGALREWRNAKAEEMGMPPYMIASNKQVQQMAQLKSFTLEALSEIRGFGKAKLDKYGKDIMRILKENKAKNESK